MKPVPIVNFKQISRNCSAVSIAEFSEQRHVGWKIATVIMEITTKRTELYCGNLGTDPRRHDPESKI